MLSRHFRCPRVDLYPQYLVFRMVLYLMWWLVPLYKTFIFGDNSEVSDTSRGACCLRCTLALDLA